MFNESSTERRSPSACEATRELVGKRMVIALARKVPSEKA